MFKHYIKDLLNSEEKEKLIAGVEAAIDYNFNNQNLLLTALVHRSMVTGVANEPVEHNERLEFLGDSIINYVITDHLFTYNSHLSEGDLSKRKSILVSTDALASCSRELGLGEFLQLGPSEKKSKGNERTSILADLFEAIIGAIYLDSDISQCNELIKRVLIPRSNELLKSEKLQNYKSELLEALQGLALGQPEYRLRETRGLEHEKVFVIEVLIGDLVLGSGEGTSKKLAQQMASKEALLKKAWL